MRQAGWYWVRLSGVGGEWTPSQLNRRGEAEIYESDAVYEIGPRIPTPDEPWQTVPVEFTKEQDEACEIEWREADEWRDLYAAMLAAAPKPEDG